MYESVDDEHLGFRYERNKSMLGKKTKSKLDKVLTEYKHGDSKTRKAFKRKRKVYFRYKNSVVKAVKE